MEENMVMENTEVVEPEIESVDTTDNVSEDACESKSSFGNGLIGGAIATGAILGGIALFKKIKAKRAAKKAAKEAAAVVEDSDEDDTEE